MNQNFSSREQVLRMAEQYHDASTVGNAFDMATVFSNMRTSLSLLKGSQMYLYNAISKYMLQTARLGKERSGFLKQNKLAQSGLWRFGVSGDLAILLLAGQPFYRPVDRSLQRCGGFHVQGAVQRFRMPKLRSRPVLHIRRQAKSPAIPGLFNSAYR